MIAKPKSSKNSKEDLDPAAAALQRVKKNTIKRGTTTPANGASVGATVARGFGGGKEPLRVKISELARHPANREPTAAAVEKMGASITRDGLLELPVVRARDGGYQIISGETRVLALRKLGRGELDVHLLKNCSDAQALELLAIYNAERTDLNPIEKARMIEKLCAEIEDGGASMSREQAAKIYGLETGAAASNLVGLLKLPKFWQELVASGEFPPTFARFLVPYAHAPRIMYAFEKDYLKSRKLDEDDEERMTWDNRACLQQFLEDRIEDYFRPLAAGHTIDFGYHAFQGKIPKRSYLFRYTGQYPCLFEITPELEKQLDCVELEVEQRVKGKRIKIKRQVATNVEAYDKLQIPLIIKKVDAKEKSAASKSAGKEKKATAEKKLTPAEQKKLDAERREQLAARISTWRHNWLKKILADAFGSPERCPEWQAYRFTLWLAGNDRLGNSIGADDKLEELLHAKGVHPDCISPISQETLPGLVHQFAAACLSHRDTNPKYSAFETQDLEAFARDLSVDLAAEFLELGKEELEVFLLLHQGPQLDPLAKEWDIYVKEGSGKSDKIKFILASGKRKPLPKSVPAIAAAKKGGK